MSQRLFVVPSELRPGSLIKPQAVASQRRFSTGTIMLQLTVNELPPESRMPSVPTILSQDHSTEEWEAHRGLFSQYYTLEDKSLSEVRVIMEYQHGFSATYVLAMFPSYCLNNRSLSERQYKRKIAAWKLEKNIKDADMKVMLRKQLKRKAEDGKESEFFINGRPVPPQKMDRFVQRKSVTEDMILQEQIGMCSFGILILLALADAYSNPALHKL